MQSAPSAGLQQPAASPAQSLDASFNLQSLTASEIGMALSQFSDQPQAIIAAWESTNLDGPAVIASTPSKIRAVILRVFPSQQPANQIAMFRFIRDSLIQTYSVSADVFDPDTYSHWPNASFTAISPMAHGGGGTGAFLPAIHGGGGPTFPASTTTMVSPAAWNTPFSAKDLKEKPMKFAFGRATSPMPIFNVGRFQTPSYDSTVGNFQPFAGAPTVTRNEFYQISLVCNKMTKAHRDRERQLDSRHLRQIPTTK